MPEAEDALGLAPPAIDALLEAAARELSFGQHARARELCDRALELLDEGADARGIALYLRGIAREDEGLDDLRAAVVALEPHPDRSLGARARLALARELARAEPSRARAAYGAAIASLSEVDLPIELAQARLGLGRLDLEEGAREGARRQARAALARLEGALSLEARRQEVLALELLGDAAEHPPEKIAFLEEALGRAERLELGRRRVLAEKLDGLRAQRGPFR